MDGHFVPNITIGPAIVAAIKPHSSKPLDVHLMIAPVDPYISAFAKRAPILSVSTLRPAHTHTAHYKQLKQQAAKLALSSIPQPPFQRLRHW